LKGALIGELTGNARNCSFASFVGRDVARNMRTFAWGAVHGRAADECEMAQRKEGKER
jgi:hypothetical protein